MKRKYLWPITLVACGLLMLISAIISSAGLVDFPLYKAVIAIPFVAHIVVKGIIGKRFYTIPIPLTVLFLLFEENIAKCAGVDSGDLISNWIVILAAILIFIGLAFITFFYDHNDEDSEEVKATKNNVSASVKYINCHDFVHETVECNMGSSKVFFSNASEYEGDATLKLNCNMGSIVVCVPADWDVDAKIDNHMGSVKVDDNTPIEGAKKLRIVGENNMGAVHVKFN